jgi:Tol biopolymer transport system component
VAFVSAHGGSADLYAYTLASGELRHIAAGEPNAAWPRWSPDGRHIVYTAVAYFGVGAGPTTNGLRVVPADGASPTRQLIGGGKQDQQLVAWVDTTQILSASYSLMGERDLEAIAIERGTRIPLVEGELAGLAWSEAAGLVAVSPGEENATVPTGLYLVDPRGPDAPLQIANQAVRNPRWSPGGRYLTHTTGDDCTLYDRELGTAHLVRGEWCGGTWSPDDHYLAYVDTSLKLVHVESGESEQISRYYEARTIRWSPDGEWMTWLRETRGGRYDLYALRPGAGRPFRAVTDLPAHGWPELGWVPGFPRDVGTTPVVTLTADTGVRIPVDAACDRVAEVLTFRKGLFYREPLERGRRQRLSLPCRLDRQAPEAGLVATEIFYQSLRFSPDRRWLIVENDNHAPCLLDLETLEGRLLPAETRVSWSPQGRQFAYVEREWSPDGPAPPHGTLMIHDAYDDTRQALWSQSGLYDVLWSPDGTRLATWAFTNEHGKRFWILDLQGTVHLTGTYAYSIHEPPLFWSPDGQRLAVSKMQPGTNYFEWEILSLEGGTTGRVDWDEVLSSPDWHPNREREAQSASSHSGAFVAQAMPPPRSKEVDWWQAPSTLRIIDAGSGATVRAWQIDGFVPTVRWSAGDGWLVYALLDIEDRQENCELGPCGIHASIWRVRVDGAGEPEMVVGNGFLVEVYE